jgi:chromate transporter
VVPHRPPTVDAVQAADAANAASLPALRLSPSELFRTFAEMSLCGFGGVMPWARRMLVDRRGWIDDREFAELLAIGQILPGPNICNIAVIVGYRYARLRGALAALSGLLGGPFVIVLVLGALYHRFGSLPAVQGALRGMTAVAAGLVMITGLKLAKSQPRNLRGLVFGLAALVSIGVAHLPLGWIMLVLMPLALAVEWRAHR